MSAVQLITASSGNDGSLICMERKDKPKFGNSSFIPEIFISNESTQNVFTPLKLTFAAFFVILKIPDDSNNNSNLKRASLMIEF